MELCWRARPVGDSTTQQQPKSPRKIRIRGNQDGLTVRNIQGCFSYLQKYNVLICREHKTGIQNIETHLRVYHGVPVEERRRIIELYEGHQLKRPDEVIPPQPMGPPFPELGEALKGFECSMEECDYLTINEDRLRMHCKKAHKMAWKEHGKGLSTAARMQTFFSAGAARRYFKVAVPEEAIGEEGQQLGEKVEARLAEWRITLERQEKVMQTMEEEIAKHDKTGWYNRTEWPEHFQGSNRIHLARAIQLPKRDEVKLLRAKEAVEQLVENSVDRLRTIPREIRRWLRSAKREEPDQRPLMRLQNPDSQARYAGYIVMFICYVLRIIASSDEEGSDDSSDDSSDKSTDTSISSSSDVESCGSAQSEKDPLSDARKLFKWHGRQKELALGLWQTLGKPDKDAHVAAVLELLKSFIFYKYKGSPFNSGLIHFTAVLGIDIETDRLRTAKNYSYMLAGMVYCIRVIGVYSLVPSDRDDPHHVEERDGFMERRREYLTDGSYSPMSEMLSLLAYGKFVALRAGNSGNAYWSKDKKTFYLNGRPILISRFQQMAQDVIAELEARFWQELLWVGDRSKRFVISLTNIVDDISFSKRGTCFINREENNLGHGLSWMLTRVDQTREGQKLQTKDGGWNARQVRKYLRRVDSFLELLLFAVHVTSGQPGRGTEVTSIRHRNGLLQDRNVYVLDGDVMTVSRYHKSQSQWDKPKVVPRFLPPRLGQLMTLYLVYLRPFKEYLEAQVLGRSFHDYIWANEQGPWETDRMTRISKRETAKRIGTPLTMLQYRHTAVGIGRVVIGNSFASGYQDAVDEVEEAEVDDEGESALELQNNRTTAMGEGNYSVPVDIIKHLSNRSIETFRPLSMAWHRFLGVHTFDPLGSQQSQRYATQDQSRNIGITENGRRWMEAVGQKRGLDCGTEDLAAKRTTIQDEAKENINRAMRQVLGQQEVSFRSAEQETAMLAVIKGQTPLVVILPTGGGKSLLFTVPACMKNAGVTIVVYPFRELINLQVKKIKGMGVECVEWKGKDTVPTSVVAVSADHVADTGFLQDATLWCEKGLVRRVVVDEAHLIFTSSNWRPKLAHLRNLRTLHCPIVLLSATIPPDFVPILGASMNIRCASYFRASTVRPMTRYMVSWCGRGEKMSAAEAMCRQQQARLKDGRKGVVYCNSKTQCEELASGLGCLYYHADVADRSKQIDGWLASGGLIVATSALGTGVDFPGIVFILHAGMPWSMIDFAQESGRGGRAGELVDSVIIVEEDEVERKMKDAAGDMDVKAIGDFINEKGCRRAMMSKYLDDKRISCSDVEGGARCDRCGEGRAEWQEGQAAEAYEWEGVQAVFDELADGCPACWVLNEEDGMHEHALWRCRKRAWIKQDRLDGFRRGIRYQADTHSCTKCGVSQRFCNTRYDVERVCQWPNVIIPIVYAAIGSDEGVSIVKEAGYTGETDGVDEQQYQVWLGRRHRQRIWGEFFSNAMVVAIRMIMVVAGKQRLMALAEVSEEESEKEEVGEVVKVVKVDDSMAARLQDRLDRWLRICGVCDGAEGHRLGQCEKEMAVKAMEVVRRWRGKVRFQQGSGCWKCGVPMELCERFEVDSNGRWVKVGERCQYYGVLLEGVWGNIAGGWFRNERMQRLKEIVDQVKGWERTEELAVGKLGEAVRMEELWTNELGRLFYWVSER